MSSLTDKGIVVFFFYRFLSHVLQRLSIAMIRFGARVRIYFWYLRGGRLFERGRIFISWENADSCCCTGALIEKFKEDEHAITETKYRNESVYSGGGPIVWHKFEWGGRCLSICLVACCADKPIESVVV